MTIELYELQGADDLRFSPFCWRARLALAHKGLKADIIPCGFTDKDRIAFSEQRKVPVLRNGRDVVSDSWRIACYLEERYPDRPSLFGRQQGRSLARFFNDWVDTQINALLVRAIVKDLYDRAQPHERDYFRETREARFGDTLENVQADRHRQLTRLETALTPARLLLRDQPYICGDEPAYADYILFGTFLWVRYGSDLEPLAPNDPLFEWRERMLDLFDGMPRHGQGARL